MSEGPSIETFTTNAGSLNGAHTPDDAPAAVDSGAGKGVLAFLGLAFVGAIVAFFVVRSTTRRRPADPTTERIQQLIDEANRLLKQLDDKQPGN